MFRWILITEKEAVGFRRAGYLTLHSGYGCSKSETDEAVVEYHVDT
jgi:hypothetical protein